MPSKWQRSSIRACLAIEFPGEWGSDGPETNALVLRSTNIDDDGNLDKASGAARWIEPSKIAWKQLRDGDILLEASGGGPGKPVGRVAHFLSDSAGPYLCSNFFRTLRALDSIDSRFLFWRLLLLQKQPAIWPLQQQTTGIINLKHKEYLDQLIEIPPPAEQRRIAEILDTLDETILETEKIIDKLEQMKKGLLHDLLTRGIDENGELRDPERHPEQFEDSPLGRIPRDWPIKKLGEVFDLRSGGTPPRSQQGRYFGGQIPWVKTMDLTEGPIESTSETISSLALKETACRLLPAGTTLVAMYGGWQQIGRTGFLTIPAAINQAISALLPVPSFQPDFLVALLQQYRYRWKGIAASTRKDPNITKDDVKEFLIPTPSNAEQDRILELLDALKCSLHGETETLLTMKATRKGLMDDLLTGRIRVRIPEDVPNA